MKWLSLILTVAEYLIPFLAKIGKNRIAKDLEVVSTGIEKFSKSGSAGDKGKAVKEMVYDLAVEAGIHNRLQKRLKGYENRIWKKLF